MKSPNTVFPTGPYIMIIHIDYRLDTHDPGGQLTDPFLDVVFTRVDRDC